MNKYTIKRLYTVIAEIEVCADTEDEARNLASERFDQMNRNNFSFNEDGTTIEDVQPIEEDVDELKDLAIAHLREFNEYDYEEGEEPEEDEIGMQLDIEVTVTVSEYDAIWQYSEDVEYIIQIEYVYVTSDGDIMVRFPHEYQKAYDLDDQSIDEFGFLDQLAILKAILAK